MAQFDIYRVSEGSLVLDCQSDLLSILTSRFVVPLRLVGDKAPASTPRLTPIFDILGDRHVMVTPLARGLDRRDIKETIGSLAAHEYEIKAALDFLVSGF